MLLLLQCPLGVRGVSGFMGGVAMLSSRPLSSVLLLHVEAFKAEMFKGCGGRR